MDVPVIGEILSFNGWRFDVRAGILVHRDGDGVWTPTRIGRRASDILALLLEKPGALVSKDEIMDAVWLGAAVEPNNLTVQITALRRVLDEGRPDESCIQTVSGKGYRFIWRVTRVDDAQFPPACEPNPDPVLTDTAPPPRQRSRWCWLIGGLGGATDAARTGAVTRQRTPTRAQFCSLAIVVAGVIGLLVCIVGAGWWELYVATAPSTSASATSAPAQDRRLSIIVLPFENISGDPAQDVLAEQITREVTARISKDGELIVIPAMTAATYRGKAIDLGTIGRQHDVHFAVVGSAHRLNGKLNVSATLYEIAGGRTVSQRRFELQDTADAHITITQVIYETFWQASIDEEAERAMRDHPNNLDKRDFLSAARLTRLSGAPTKAHILEQIALIDQALALDPNYFLALERRARLHAALVLTGYSSAPAADLAIADKATDHMLSIDPNSPISLRAKATVLRAKGDWREAEVVLRKVIVMQPTEANRRYELGQILMAEGRHEEALESFQTAKRFAGGTDPVFAYDANIAMAELAIGELADAESLARLAISEFPPDNGFGDLPWLALIGAESSSGQEEAAHADLQKFLVTRRRWGSMTAIEKQPAFNSNAKLLDGLRLAGMPVE